MSKTWTEEEFIEAVKNSTNYSQVMRKLKIGIHGNNHKTIKRWISNLQLDISHFCKPVPPGPTIRKTFDECFCVGSVTGRGFLKRTILAKNLFPYECSICHLSSWLDQKITLQLDHINGVNNDHRLENLRFLCPNCHSQTPTFAGKRVNNYLPEKFCPDCASPIKPDRQRCRKCSLKANPPPQHMSKIQWPEPEILLQRVKESSYVKVGKELGVSDSGVRRHLSKFFQLSSKRKSKP